MSDPGLKGTLHPALRPENVHAIIKEAYRIPAKARELFRDVNEPLDEYRDIIDNQIAGEIGKVSGGDGFNFLQSKFASEVGTVEGFGGAFKMTFEEKKWSRINLVEKKMRDLIYKMRKYYENQVLASLNGASGVNTFNGSDWTDTTAGDPFSDLEDAKGRVYDTHGVSPDILILNRAQYLKLIKFKEYREYRLLGKSNYEAKNIWDDLTPNGLQMVIFDNSLNAYLPDNEVWVAKAKDMGVNHVAIPQTSFERDDPDSPLNTNYFIHEWTTPAVDSIDAKAICKITGLDA